jgi:hypothetical protein
MIPTKPTSMTAASTPTGVAKSSPPATAAPSSNGDDATVGNDGSAIVQFGAKTDQFDERSLCTTSAEH